MAQPPFRIKLLATERTELETLIRTHPTPRGVAWRARTLLMATSEWQSNRRRSMAAGF